MHGNSWQVCLIYGKQGFMFVLDLQFFSTLFLQCFLMRFAASSKCLYYNTLFLILYRNELHKLYTKVKVTILVSQSIQQCFAPAFIVQNFPILASNFSWSFKWKCKQILERKSTTLHGRISSKHDSWGIQEIANFGSSMAELWCGTVLSFRDHARASNINDKSIHFSW
jgi:hypothetical protein